MSGERDTALCARLAGLGLTLGLLVASAMPVLAQADDLGDVGDDKPTPSDEAASSDAEQTPKPAPPPEAPSYTGPAVVIRPYVGSGISTRSFSRPGMPIGVQKLSGSVVPAAEVGLDVIAWPEADFSLDMQLHYQTALGLVVTESPPFALENEVKVRSERIELSVAPSWRIGGGAFQLSIPIGAIVRTFWPNVHTLLSPGYSLIGPHARLELDARIAGPVTIRIGPEVQWIMLIDRALRDTGVNSQGIAIGGEATLLIALSSVWSLAIAYRESHAIANSTRGVTFEDIERYLTLRVRGAF